MYCCALAECIICRRCRLPGRYSLAETALRRVHRWTGFSSPHISLALQARLALPCCCACCCTAPVGHERCAAAGGACHFSCHSRLVAHQSRAVQVPWPRAGACALPRAMPACHGFSITRLGSLQAKTV